MAVPRIFLPWVRVPAEGVLDFLTALTWKKSEKKSAACDLAALMIYLLMLMLLNDQFESNNDHLYHGDGVDSDQRISISAKMTSITYDEIINMIGLSRSMISQGIQRLIELGKISAEGSNQKRTYLLNGIEGRWFKVPCRAIMNKAGIPALKTFNLRSKHELNALKLYFYLASVRDNKTPYSEARYEKIFEKTKISERDIRKAINILITCGLLARVNRESYNLNASWGANLYFMSGHNDLFPKSATKI